MQDLNDKVTGGTLTAAEWNEVPSEIQNVIESAGITLSGGDLQQQVKAVAAYASVGEFFTGGGAADAYTVAAPSPRIAPASLLDGMKFRAVFGATNTGASTLNPFGLGVTDIKLSGGVTDPAAGEIASGEETTLIYRTSPSAHFELISAVTLSKYFISTEQVITSAGALTLPHGLGAKPTLVRYVAICKTAEFGYSVGDEVDINPAGNDPGSGGVASARGLSSVTDVTNVNIRYGLAAQVFGHLRKDTGNLTALNNANWRLIVRAWA